MSFSVHIIESPPFPFVRVQEIVAYAPRTPAEDYSHLPGVEFIFVMEGHTRRWLNDRPEISAEPGDILVLGSFCRHRVAGAKHDSTKLRQWIINTSIPRGMVGENSSAPTKTCDDDKTVASLIRQYCLGVHHLRPSRQSGIGSLLVDLRSEAEKSSPGKQLKIGAICTSLVVEIVRLLHKEQAVPEREERSSRSLIIEETRELLWKNMEHPLTLDQIAWKLRLSEQHLGRIFKREMGLTVFDYLKYLRIERAKLLLSDPLLTITHVAERTGFSSLSLFSRTFQRLTGERPTAYRTHLLNNIVLTQKKSVSSTLDGLRPKLGE